MAVERRPQVIDYSEESQAEKFARKSKEAPYVPIGMLCNKKIGINCFLTSII